METTSLDLHSFSLEKKEENRRDYLLVEFILQTKHSKHNLG